MVLVYVVLMILFVSVLATFIHIKVVMKAGEKELEEAIDRKLRLERLVQSYSVEVALRVMADEHAREGK